MIDADTGLAARWQSLRDRLLEAGYPNVPAGPDPKGTILPAPGGTSLLPRVGIWLMPDNQTEGILEDFLRFLVPEESQPLLDHAESSIAAIPDGERRFGPLDEPKALIHTWLAWQEEPGKPFGTAITAGFLDPNLPQADALAAWLDKLFFQ